MAEPVLTLSAGDLADLVTDANLFRAEVGRFASCEAADAEPVGEKRTEARRRIATSGFLWAPKDLSAAEVDLLYGMAREAARIALARRSAAFRAKYGIALTCGDELEPVFQAAE